MPVWLVIGCVVLVFLGLAGTPFAFGAMMAYGAPESAMGLYPALTKLSLIAIILFPAFAWAGAFGAWQFHTAGAGAVVSLTFLAAPLIYMGAALTVYSYATQAGAAPPRPAFADEQSLRAYIVARPALEELDLSDMGLAEVPAAVYAAVNLKRLNLARNKLTRIPDDLGRMPKLELLYINGNPVPPEEERRWLAARQNKAVLNSSAP